MTIVGYIEPVHAHLNLLRTASSNHAAATPAARNENTMTAVAVRKQGKIYIFIKRGRFMIACHDKEEMCVRNTQLNSRSEIHSTFYRYVVG